MTIKLSSSADLGKKKKKKSFTRSRTIVSVKTDGNPKDSISKCEVLTNAVLFHVLIPVTESCNLKVTIYTFVHIVLILSIQLSTFSLNAKFI